MLCSAARPLPHRVAKGRRPAESVDTPPGGLLLKLIVSFSGLLIGLMDAARDYAPVLWSLLSAAGRLSLTERSSAPRWGQVPSCTCESTCPFEVLFSTYTSTGGRQDSAEQREGSRVHNPSSYDTQTQVGFSETRSLTLPAIWYSVIPINAQKQ